ncbi:MAG TPA: MFS transporter [Acidimicrobiia bacterium]|nr:MFS transporter [Acidimicrobiia bacterium]
MATALSALPPFLIGSLMPAMRADIDIDTERLGVLIAIYFLASAVAAVPGGRLAERLGPRRGLLLTGTVTALSLLLIAGVVETWLHLAAVIVLAGFANGMVHPAGNLAIVRGVPGARRGSAFGIKQAAAPLATLFAGLALPVLALTLGWRQAFLSAVLLLPLIALVLPAHLPSGSTARRVSRLRADRPLVVIALASALGFGAATTVGAFLVDSVVSAGSRPGVAGATLTAASAACIGVRLFIGWQTDRMRRPSINLVAALMVLGAAGFALLAVSPSMIWPLGAVVGMGAGWGWPGLLYHAVAESHPSAPAAATAVATTGNALGAALGPLGFGLVASRFSFDLAWGASATAMVLAAALMVAAGRLRAG